MIIFENCRSQTTPIDFSFYFGTSTPPHHVKSSLFTHGNGGTSIAETQSDEVIDRATNNMRTLYFLSLPPSDSLNSLNPDSEKNKLDLANLKEVGLGKEKKGNPNIKRTVATSQSKGGTDSALHINDFNIFPALLEKVLLGGMKPSLLNTLFINAASNKASLNLTKGIFSQLDDHYRQPLSNEEFRNVSREMIDSIAIYLSSNCSDFLQLPQFRKDVSTVFKETDFVKSNAVFTELIKKELSEYLITAISDIISVEYAHMASPREQDITGLLIDILFSLLQLPESARQVAYLRNVLSGMILSELDVLSSSGSSAGLVVTIEQVVSVTILVLTSGSYRDRMPNLSSAWETFNKAFGLIELMESESIEKLIRLVTSIQLELAKPNLDNSGTDNLKRVILLSIMADFAPLEIAVSIADWIDISTPIVLPAQFADSKNGNIAIFTRNSGLAIFTSPSLTERLQFAFLMSLTNSSQILKSEDIVTIRRLDPLQQMRRAISSAYDRLSESVMHVKSFETMLFSPEATDLINRLLQFSWAKLIKAGAGNYNDSAQFRVPVKTVLQTILAMKSLHPSAIESLLTFLFFSRYADHLVNLPDYVMDAAGLLFAQNIGLGPFEYRGPVLAATFDYVKLKTSGSSSSHISRVLEDAGAAGTERALSYQSAISVDVNFSHFIVQLSNKSADFQLVTVSCQNLLDQQQDSFFESQTQQSAAPTNSSIVSGVDYSLIWEDSAIRAIYEEPSKSNPLSFYSKMD